MDSFFELDNTQDFFLGVFLWTIYPYELLLSNKENRGLKIDFILSVTFWILGIKKRSQNEFTSKNCLIWSHC